MSIDVAAFFDEDTFTVSYVASDPATRKCAIIDSVLDYDPASGRTRRRSADRVISHVEKQDLTTEWILETHIHADHLSAAGYLQSKLGGRLGVGEHVAVVQRTFGAVFNAGPAFPTDGRQFDHLFRDG